MRTIRCLAPTTVLVMVLTILPVHAQTTPNDWSRLSSLEVGTTVSVKRKNGKSVRGALNSVSESTLRVIVKGTTQEIKREDVKTVHRVEDKSATKATLIGLGVGAGAGAVAGAAVGSNDNSFDKLDKAATGVLTILGAGVGALTGYLIGRSSSKKELIYEAK